MRKFVPYLFCGVAAVSFSTLAQTSASSDNPTTNPAAQGRSVDTQGARPDSSKAQGTVPQVSGSATTTAPAASGTVTTTPGSASVGSSGVQSNNQGRSVNTGGASPDSSKAQGSSPVTSGATTADRNDKVGEGRRGHDASSTGASRDEEARRKTREGTTSGIGGGTTTTGSGATTATPGSPAGPNSGAGAGAGGAGSGSAQ